MLVDNAETLKTDDDTPREFPSLPKWVTPGALFRYNFGPENTYTGREFHVRAIVDGQAVIREWSDKTGWLYTIEGPSYFRAYGRRLVPEKLRKQPGKSSSKNVVTAQT